MKKIICLFIIVCMCITLCACASSPSSPEDEIIGYVIIPHADGDEYADITDYQYSHGTIKVWCVDGRKVISTNITIILE